MVAYTKPAHKNQGKFVQENVYNVPIYHIPLSPFPIFLITAKYTLYTYGVCHGNSIRLSIHRTGSLCKHEWKSIVLTNKHHNDEIMVSQNIGIGNNNDNDNVVTTHKRYCSIHATFCIVSMNRLLNSGVTETVLEPETTNFFSELWRTETVVFLVLSRRF